MSFIRVLAEFGLCASLAQQIPALIEFTLQFAETLLFFLCIDLTQLGRIPQRPFLFHHLRCHEDRTIPAALQLLFVTQTDAAFPHNPTHVVELAASHSALLSVPDRVADMIVGRDEAATTPTWRPADGALR